MREILFRAKRISGGWVYGGILATNHPNYDKPCYAICANGKDYFVDQESIGQFTGLTDKNGKKIFEGDIVKQTFAKSVPLYASSWGSDEYEDICGDDVGSVVIIPSKGACIKNPIIYREVDGEITEHGKKSKMRKPVCSRRCEVIGNIHDNPELLEVSDGTDCNL